MKKLDLEQRVADLEAHQFEVAKLLKEIVDHIDNLTKRLLILEESPSDTVN